MFAIWFSCRKEAEIMKRYRIANKFRFTVFATLCILVSVLMVSSFLGRGEVYSAEEKSYITVEVCSGDTLWDLACAYGPSNRDVRQVVSEICSLNDVSAYTLRPGLTILIPQT